MFSLLGYPVSYMEFVGTVFGIAGVWLAAKANILTWPVGLVNIILFFLIFYQVQLYSDMFLQIYFFLISLYGWFFWDKELHQKEPIKFLSNTWKIYLAVLCTVLTFTFGYVISQLHNWFPIAFPKQAAYPYWDTFVAIASIIANTLLARRIIENWIIWIVVDVICIYLYFSKGIAFVALEFIVFLGLACYGAYHWHKLYLKQKKIAY
ncbi:MAG: nicotinamide mononucleotide transporter [Saprospiraceae bacterium]|nr:nicotinamide mononucleotide transporter [Candidatus Vicinibacter affinis]MBK9641846.1 nicotinamide mononucleotide transporter [Candidatus Vicinibacter affinis]